MKRHTVFVLSLFASSFFITYCGTIEFKSSGHTPFKIAAGKNSDDSLEVESSYDFYFWGMSPKVGVVDLEDATRELGVNRPSFVAISQNVGWKSFFYSIVTLGLYCPVDYKIKVLTTKEKLE